MYTAGVFKEIVPMEKIVTTDYFSDENGEPMSPAVHGLPSDTPTHMTVTILFEEIEGGKTKLSIMYPPPATEAEFEAMKKSGMQEGWQSSLNKLEAAIKQ